MLYMIIENFHGNDPNPAGQRFQRQGRMAPEGLTYISSWMASSGARCYQLMETNNPKLLEEWMNNWKDLIDFEVVPVQTSADFWSKL